MSFIRYNVFSWIPIFLEVIFRFGPIGQKLTLKDRSTILRFHLCPKHGKHDSDSEWTNQLNPLRGKPSCWIDQKSFQNQGRKISKRKFQQLFPGFNSKVTNRAAINQHATSTTGITSSVTDTKDITDHYMTNIWRLRINELIHRF